MGSKSIEESAHFLFELNCGLSVHISHLPAIGEEIGKIGIVLDCLLGVSVIAIDLSHLTAKPGDVGFGGFAREISNGDVVTHAGSSVEGFFAGPALSGSDRDDEVDGKELGNMFANGGG